MKDFCFHIKLFPYLKIEPSNFVIFLFSIYNTFTTKSLFLQSTHVSLFYTFSPSCPSLYYKTYF